MDNRKKLLELIEKRNIPMSPEEAKEHIDNLSDEEIELLLSTYGDLENAEDAIDEVLAENMPEEFQKAKSEYEQKLKSDKDEYKEGLNTIADEVAVERDDFEDGVLKESKKAVDEMNAEVAAVEDTREELIKVSEASNE